MVEAKRVVVTGIGVLSSLGQNLEEFWKNLVVGKNGIKPYSAIKEKGAKFFNAGFIEDFNPDIHFTHQQKNIFWRNSQLSIVAARAAVSDSGINFGNYDKYSTAIIMGSASTDGVEEEALFERYYKDNNTRLNPLTLVHLMRGGIVHQIANECDIHGPGIIIDTACASALQAVGEAFKMIQLGRAKTAIAGGGESPFGITHWKAWEQIGAMSPDVCRPFCKERNGTILGEGAGAFVLEELEQAQGRGAKIYGEICGFASTRDGLDLTKPSLEHIAKTMELAINDSKLKFAEIDYVNAHGSGTKLNDMVETQAIKKIFGAQAYDLAISASKSMHGHLEFATGAVELVGAFLAMKESIIPPTINFLTKDSDCDLNYTPNSAEKREIRSFIKNSFGFGGANASIVVKDFKQ